jgi:hypothetical protein
MYRHFLSSKGQLITFETKQKLWVSFEFCIEVFTYFVQDLENVCSKQYKMYLPELKHAHC